MELANKWAYLDKTTVKYTLILLPHFSKNKKFKTTPLSVRVQEDETPVRRTKHVLKTFQVDEVSGLIQCVDELKLRGKHIF